jgi:isopenicillin-N epimerase
MEQSRRDFLKVFGKATAGLGLASLTGVPLPLTSGVPTASACVGSGGIDWQEIRKQYFRLSRDYIYMNNSTMGATLKPVSDRMAEVQKIFSEGCTIDRFNSLEVVYILSWIRERFREVVNGYGGYPTVSAGKYVGNVDSVTEGMSVVANGITFDSSDAIFITDYEHTGARTMWELQRDRYGAKLVTVPLIVAGEREDQWAGNLVQRFRTAMSNCPSGSSPKVLSFPYITTSTGHILPAKELCALASIEFDAISVIDAAQAFTILPINVIDLDCDFFVVNGHKYLCGPIGSGFICINPRQMSSFWGTIVDDNYYYPSMPSRNYPQRKGGITPYTNIIPLLDALNIYDKGPQSPPTLPPPLVIPPYDGFSIGADNVYDRLLQIGKWLRSGLSSFPTKFELITPQSDGLSCVMTCFRVINKSSESVYQDLKNIYGIHVKHSTEGFGTGPNVNGAVRLAPHYYNTEKEFKQLAKALCGIAGVSVKDWPDFPG